MSLLPSRKKEITAEEAAEIVLNRRKGRTRFADFCRALTPEEVPALHHEVLCDALDEVADGLNDRLMVFMPPGSAKSTYSSKKFPAYYLGKYPTNSIICGSYGEGLSTTFGKAVRNIVLSREYGVLFDTRLSEDSRAKGEWETKEGGSYYAVGVGSGVTGRRADLLLIDDPVKGRKDADSELVRNEIWNWYLADFTSRAKLDAPTAQIIIQCMTGDTPVLMSEGTEKPLREIRIGDAVATYRNGKLSTSTVRNWASNGFDSVYRIKTNSGKIVRANERHPFLVERKGKLEWVRLKNLAVGESVLTVTGENTGGLNAPTSDARETLTARGYAQRITTRKGGLMAYVRRLLSKILPHALAQNSNTVTALLLMTTRFCFASRAEDAPFVSATRQTRETPNIGTTSCASITAMKPQRFAGCSAMIAIWLSGAEKTLKPWKRQRPTSDFILDKIASIEPDGMEEVFDVQIEGTENFITNGLVSHNTRWHEDDLSGRILPKDWNFESGVFTGFDGQPWKVICLPAQAQKNDILGRKEGEWLWPEGINAKKWETIKQVQVRGDIRNWSALYQQRPQPESGVYFKREWFQRYKTGTQPPITPYAASDYAVSDGKGDWTEHGVGGFDKDKHLWFTDWWSGQTTSDVWINEQVSLAKTHQPRAWVSEVGVIRRAVEPWLMKRQRDKDGEIFRMEWLPHIGDKGAHCRAFQAMASQGMVHIPECDWGDNLLDELIRFIPATNYKDDKADVCGHFGRIVHSSFAPSEPEKVEEKERDSYGFDEPISAQWKVG